MESCRVLNKRRMLTNNRQEKSEISRNFFDNERMFDEK